ncbi:MAG TPA: flagellar biosynthetic protein FliP [Bauldia sp.]|nr:flagellar biosynthetic protein FliP [Bauldia sp.]
MGLGKLPARGRRAAARLAVAAAILPLTTSLAFPQAGPLDGILSTGDTTISGRIVQLILLLTVLSVAPGLLIMVTSFTRFVIALSFLRTGLGLQSTPANLVLISLSLFLTFYVMAPTFDKAWQDGVRPLMNNTISEEEAFARVTDPFRTFMLTQVRPKDLALFSDLFAARAAGTPPPAAGSPPVPPPAAAPATPGAAIAPVDLRVLIPAFMISELRRAFEIGFLVVLPFLVIDMVVATLVMSMGMMMMPPSVVALPFKVLFFILIDGWNLLVDSLVRSYF